MIIKLDMTSNIPIYVQLRNEIVMGIGRGELKKGKVCQQLDKWQKI